MGLRGGPALAISVWRGCSGRRYVVVVQPLASPDFVAKQSAVVLAGGRGEHGQASIVAARACEVGDPGFLGWFAACAGLGPCELHAYRLAETKCHRSEIAADVGSPAVNTAAGAA